MPDYADSGHRPHGIHTGEVPENPIDRGPANLKVTLDAWGPRENLFTTLYDSLQANWGDAPSRTVDRSSCPSGWPNTHWELGLEHWEHATGWCMLSAGEREYVESCFAGKTLNQVLEGITFYFSVDGCSRAFTHQYVRSRIGAAFMQHGGRDNDWRHRHWTMPETIARACDAFTDREPTIPNSELKHCITDWGPIDAYLKRQPCFDGYQSDGKGNPTLFEAIRKYLMLGRELYSALVDAGIPWQDARRVLWMGTQTYIHAEYNYLALQGVAGKRLEHIMDWEINAVVQLMVREVKMKCPPVFGKYLASWSDKLGKAAMAGLESWTPDGKHPNPYETCSICGFKKDHVNHTEVGKAQWGEQFGHVYKPKDTLHRQHRPEQAPFWVLHPDSMAGGEIKWVPTNGEYPKTF